MPSVSAGGVLYRLNLLSNFWNQSSRQLVGRMRVSPWTPLLKLSINLKRSSATRFANSCRLASLVPSLCTTSSAQPRQPHEPCSTRPCTGVTAMRTAKQRQGGFRDVLQDLTEVLTHQRAPGRRQAERQDGLCQSGILLRSPAIAGA